MTTRPSLRELDRLMRERVGLAPAPVPTPLHKMGKANGPPPKDGPPLTTGRLDHD